MINQLTGFLAVVLSLSVPIIFIILYYKEKMYRKKCEMDLRMSLIENHADAETAKVLIENQQAKPQKKSSDIFKHLRISLSLIFMGIAYCPYHFFVLCDFDPLYEPWKKLGLVVVLALGAGIGLLISVIIQYRLEKKRKDSSLVVYDSADSEETSNAE